ncbi:SusC/RagA family TonB-linked outer membrane protein [Flavobacterium sp. N3904]|uniref:SusC/RagA family TonB-linked outer membrane protein n=1 Tax=Flavobacterium sp. N3904 TaxID=2986835 RepID=UPI002223F1A2|nr:TonB-dependent receptor [Flavobacterium sp. N3904]
MKRKYCTSTMLPFCMSLLFSVFMLQSGFAQQKSLSVTGKITSTSDGLGIPGANITVEGGTTSTSTDFDGTYKINVKSDDVLKISVMGYKSQKVSVNNQSTINVALQTETSDLKEVVVIGYGTQKKKVATAATSTISAKSIQEVASIDVVNALQGQASGVNVTSTSGQPGAGMVINIRGVGTAGNSNPLYVVDGIVIDGGIGYLDPSAIERVDILKDASAAAIYGARAANGVVLVTTKKGKGDKMAVSLNGYTGFQYVAKKIDLLNSTEYATIMNEARVNSGLTPLYTQAQMAALPNTDWQDEMVNEGALKQNQSLLISGATANSTYATGMSNATQEGLIGSQDNQSKYVRRSFFVNTTTSIIPEILKFGENFTYSNIGGNGISDQGIYNNSVRGFLNAPPTMDVYNPDGTYAKSDIAPDIANPLGSMYYNNFKEYKGNRFIGNAFLEAKFLKGFTFITNFGADSNDSFNRSFVPVYDLSSTVYNAISTVTQSSGNAMTWSWENTLDYKASLGKNNFDVLVGTSARSQTSEYSGATGKDLIFNDFKHAYLSNATLQPQNTVWGGRSDYKMASLFGRLLYNYDDKYLFTGTIRRDGSSNFGPNNKYAIFPAFSAGWNVDREDFFPKDIFLNKVKLRASWGENGNDQLKQFAYLSTISSIDKSYHFGVGNNEHLYVGAAPNDLNNPDLKWETSEQTDLGFDLVLFEKVTFVFDWYNKVTRDWLVQPTVTETTGANAPYINGGDIQNKGVEFALGYATTFGTDWNFSINGNLSYNQNEVLKIANQSGIIYGDPNLLFQGLDEMNRVQVGKPIGYFYGLKTDGIFQNASEVAAGVQPNAVPGDVRFVDLNGDGKINQDDKTEVGNPNPDLTYGVNMQVSYKAFDFSIFTYGTAGGQNAFGVHDPTRPYNNYTTTIIDRWTTEGTSNTIPRVTYGSDPNGNYTKFSDLYIQDSDFFRIKDVTFGVDLTKLSSNLGFFSKFRLYVAVNNLYTFTKYQGMDPEIGFGNSNQSWAKGIDVGFYPQPRTYMVGFNVNF